MGRCVGCTLTGCIQCSSLTTCQQCDNISRFINTISNQCEVCTIPNCIQCQTLSSCNICNTSNNYFLAFGFCQPCTITGCLQCLSLTSCQLCDTLAGYGFDIINPNLCGPCFVSCTCDGYGLPWRPIEAKCTAHCGDGLVRLEEQCDDNNLNAGDGCSPTCRIDRYYTCVG
jgi:cysteine-rich repeat protein